MSTNSFSWRCKTSCEIYANRDGSRPTPSKFEILISSASGWAGGSTASIEAELKATGIEIARPALTYKYVPDAKEIEECFNAGQESAKNL